ncbi:GDYXXLXY domain-containing protein [Endozoicomonas sp. SM1973]|uniref:GDYXXLXY domain-containing protein n=1 Tax=Spartinivicinus marinus TaxID=2994442 RepID=A0A853IGX1_9GAMM|nr:GDYXXLXY domain-containing protein [Spartinivicinus marinus]MCX4026444.1 GDYXXLXY domain-containing protein [Spartinivicinus marinus]NYZ66816.1 GDYXXLXY domain-containing protein [Spartinivicinus marinus]
MQRKLLVICSLLVLVILNYAIFKKEQTIAHGETLLLELAPVDPRSLLQGDYMALDYAIARKASTKELSAHHRRGFIVIKGDNNNVAQFVRFYEGKPLEAEEKLLRFHHKYNRVRIVPHSFFFQEGHAKYYENAKYGVYRFDNSGNRVLVGLAGDDRQMIEPSLDRPKIE